MLNINYLCKGYTLIKDNNPFTLKNMNKIKSKNKKIDYYRLSDGFRMANDNYIVYRNKKNNYL